MILSNRLRAIYDMVGEAGILADVGTDHAYLAISLLADDKVSSIILSDVNRGPLETAKKNVRQAGINEDVSFRLGSGLKPYDEGEADVFVIAGMGGNLISEILKESEEVARSADFLVLQPMKNQSVLRKYLNDNSFKILEEVTVREDNRFYEIIKASNGRQKELTNTELELGCRMKKDACYNEFLNYKREKYTTILSRIEAASRNVDVSDYEEFIDEIDRLSSEY